MPASTRYQDAPLLISDLNDHLEEAGASTCAMRNPDLDSGYAKTIPNQGAAVYEFDDGTPLYVLIVSPRHHPIDSAIQSDPRVCT